EAKDRFLAVLSHELRTPLTPIVAALAILDDLMPQEDARQALAILRRNVEMETQLIDDLLDLTRVTRGKLQLRRQAVDLHVIACEIVVIASSEASANRVVIATNFQARMHHVHGDILRLRQVIWNLVRNAVKFTPEGGRITLATRNRLAAGAK